MTFERQRGKSLFTSALCAAASAEMRKPDPALKGVQGENCNRTDCQQPEAHYFNIGTNAYYCWACASDINEFAMRDHADGSKMNLFPTLEADRKEQVRKMLRQHDAFAEMLMAGERRSALVGSTPTVVSVDELYDFDLPTREPKQKAQWKRERQGRR
jgi:hypothetical protein